MKPEDLGDLQSLNATIEQTICDIGIPSRPEILNRISAEMIKDSPNLRHLGHLIEADMGLSAGLIKTANSPYFGFRSKVFSPQEALTVLGLDVASQAIAGIILRKVFATSDPRIENLLTASAQVAALSGWIAGNDKSIGVLTNLAYTFGLFRDCGIPVMLVRFPTYARALEKANSEFLLEFTRVEQDGLPEFPIDHALVGSLLVESWWLPEGIRRAIQCHHDVKVFADKSGEIPLSCKKLIAIGHLAEHLRSEVLNNRISMEWGKLGAASLDILGLEEKKLLPLYEGAAAVLDGFE